MTELLNYVPGYDADLLLAQLWARMNEDGDLDALFSDAHFPLSSLLAASAPPNELVCCTDPAGIWLAVWFNPIMRGAFVSAYVRPDMRAALRATITYRRVLDHGVERYGTLLGLTRHARLLPVHRALGYEHVGIVPAIFPQGENGYLMCYTGNRKGRSWRTGSKAQSAAV